MVCLFIFLTLSFYSSTIAAALKASTRYGDVEGFAYRMKSGEDANVFLGIPYASPPTGALRFEVNYFFTFENYLLCFFFCNI